jgi:DNA-binding NarL/FixJ family response regulator
MSPTEPPIRLLLVDDHEIVRIRLRTLFAGSDGIDVVAEAATGTEAVDEAARTRPGVVLMDVRLRDGSAATRAMIDRMQLLLASGTVGGADLLSSQEYRVLALVAQGKTNKAIATALRSGGNLLETLAVGPFSPSHQAGFAGLNTPCWWPSQRLGYPRGRVRKLSPEQVGKDPTQMGYA